MTIEEIKQKITLKKVVSSNLKAIGFNKEEEKLYVMFSSNALYEYIPVKESLYIDFLGSQSKGSFFFKNIKNNKEIKFKQMNLQKLDIKIEE